jgi:hypothetical protein
MTYLVDKNKHNHNKFGFSLKTYTEDICNFVNY